MTGLVTFAVTVGGYAAAFSAFVVAALVLVVLLFAAAVAVARLEEETMKRVEAQAPTIKRWGGWVLLVVGGWLILLAIFTNFFIEVFPV